MLLKRFIRVFLAMMLTTQPMTILASENANSSDVLLQVVPQSFAATVPTGLPIKLLQNGQIIVATDAQIINNSKGPIKVSNISAETKVAGWSLANFSDDFTSKKVGSKELGLQFRGDDISFIGECSLNPVNWPTINGNDNLALVYDGKLVAQRKDVNDVVVANAIFTLDWDSDNTIQSEANIEDLYNSEYSFTPGDSRLVRFNFVNATSNNITWTTSHPDVATIEDFVSATSRDLMSGTKQAKITALSSGQTTITGKLDDGTSCDFRISVVDKQVKSLDVTKLPNKKTYVAGEDFDETGLEVTATYNNGTSEIITDYILKNNLNLLAHQTQVGLDYGDKTINILIVVTVENNYVLAGDSDFTVYQSVADSSVSFRYKGISKYVEIPHIIKGNKVTNYSGMFQNTSVEGVKSTNKNVTNMDSMFTKSIAINLDVSQLDTSNVTSMDSMFKNSFSNNIVGLSNFNTFNVTSMMSMFEKSQATSLDLSGFDVSNVINVGWMFNGCVATTGYAKTQSDADKLNGSANKPTLLTFVVKS